ncbi:hypothetical protein F5X98DRAFT_327871 [Xylaria grammica]|nr:hypothetical protein F5X98DRAFT_327871 [Xylaria grammica]
MYLYTIRLTYLAVDLSLESLGGEFSPSLSLLFFLPFFLSFLLSFASFHYVRSTCRAVRRSPCDLNPPRESKRKIPTTKPAIGGAAGESHHFTNTNYDLLIWNIKPRLKAKNQYAAGRGACTPFSVASAVGVLTDQLRDLPFSPAYRFTVCNVRCDDDVVPSNQPQESLSARIRCSRLL